MLRSTVLVVEDTADYQEIYRRHIERLGAVAVLVSDLGSAERSISARAFAAALIDIRLSEQDQENVDGLKVLELLQRTEDGTKAIVITGHGTFRTARESLVKYGAFRVVEKEEITPPLLESLVKEALEAFNFEFMKKNVTYSYILKPADLIVWEWEDRVLRICTPEGGTSGLYAFFEQFVRRLLPLVALSRHVAITTDAENRSCKGAFWSRGVGRPVLVLFGSQAAIREETRKLEEAGSYPGALLGATKDKLELGEALVKQTASGLTGVAYEVKNLDVSEFTVSG